MSFSTGPTYGSWRHILGFVLAFVLFLANLFILAMWLMSFWDPSTDTYRSIHWLDFVLMPGTFLLTFGIIKLYVRFIVRD
ncbi:MAG: hypothetical protein ACEQR8_08710 [Cypionkella sp.]